MVLRDIIATQNFQIQTMLSILEAKNIPETKDCIVEVPKTTERVIEDMPHEDEADEESEVSKSVNDVPVSSGRSVRASQHFGLLLLFILLAKSLL